MRSFFQASRHFARFWQGFGLIPGKIGHGSVSSKLQASYQQVIFMGLPSVAVQAALFPVKRIVSGSPVFLEMKTGRPVPAAFIRSGRPFSWNEKERPGSHGLRPAGSVRGVPILFLWQLLPVSLLWQRLSGGLCVLFFSAVSLHYRRPVLPVLLPGSP